MIRCGELGIHAVRFTGRRGERGEPWRVTLGGRELLPDESIRVFRHVSPELARFAGAFKWGPELDDRTAQLALAILLCYVAPAPAVQFHRTFEREVIGRLPATDFSIVYDVPGWLVVHVKTVGARQARRGEVRA